MNMTKNIYFCGRKFHLAAEKQNCSHNATKTDNDDTDQHN